MIIPDWAKELNCSITVCDKDGVIIYQNGYFQALC